MSNCNAIKSELSKTFNRWLNGSFKFTSVLPSGVPTKKPEFALFSDIKNDVNLDDLRIKLDQDARNIAGVERATIETYDDKYCLKVILDRQAFIESVINLFRHGIRNYSSLSSYLIPPRKQIIEFSSPNIAKPFHCGHLRSTIIGNALANINTFIGHDVIRLNYLGDWGTQFGLLSQGYEDFGDANALESDPIKHLLDVYVKANHEAQVNSDYIEKSRSKFSLLEKKHDPQLIKLWKQFRDLSIEEYKKIYATLGINFHEFHFESSYDVAGRHYVNELEMLGIVKTGKDGSKYVEAHHERDKNESIILLKNDGTTIYLTRDIAAAIDRKEKYCFDEMYYVVGHSQWMHFVRLKDILLRMGKDWASNIHHVVFGDIKGMSTRKGQVVLLQDVIDEARLRCKESTLKAATTKSSPDKFDELATILGLSAVFVYELRHPKGTHYEFQWNDAMKLTGYTGVFLQYAHARISSIKEKCGIELDRNCPLDWDALDDKPLWGRLFVLLSQFDDIVSLSSERCDPSIFVRYLLYLSHRSNGCIENYPVKGSAKSVGQTRLLIFNCVQEILNIGMKLIGLKPLDKI